MKALSSWNDEDLVQQQLDQESRRSYPDDVSRQSKTLKIKIDYLVLLLVLDLDFYPFDLQANPCDRLEEICRELRTVLLSLS